MYLWACLLAAWLTVSPALGAVCPDACVCSTTRDGLHRAACSDVTKLYKFTLRQKHHNVNILDLSHNNISRLTHELDRLTEVVTLDLSTNGLTNLDKFLHNAKKLVHLNLANNRFQHLSMTSLPTSVSSVDLTNNLLRDVPYDLKHLSGLEHLELEGNPLDCSCDNILARDQLLLANVFIDNVKCSSPRNLKGLSWLELKTKSICNAPKYEHNYLDMMMGDQPVDAVQVGEETTALKSMPLVANSDLEDGNIIQGDQLVEDDSQQFIRVNKLKYTQATDEVEGSGDTTDTTPSQDIIEARNVNPVAEEKKEDTTEDTIEGSGFEGSGFGFYNEELEKSVETTTTTPPALYTGPIVPLIPDDNTSEYPIPPPPAVYEGGPLWHSETTLAPVIERVETERSATVQLTRDTTVSEPIRVTQASDVNDQASSEPAPHKTGTYVCIAIIIAILVGLIGFAIIKGQMRKRRDRRLLRQQKRDVEKASKEMVDMNKSLLGKPALIDTPIEKKVNGKYELVPTHENNQKNGDVSNGMKHSDNKGTRTDSPRDTNQNKSSSKDNNLADEKQSSPTQQDTSFESGPTSPDSRKDTHSLSSEDIFVPINDDDGPKLNGVDSDASQGLLNGDQSFSDFLSPSREYVPVYSPDMGRVRIKLSETPKPKTPVLVTRSRSNAGDIIITPAASPGARTSAT